MATFAGYQTLMDAVVTAIAASDLATAKSKIAQAEATLLALEQSANRSGSSYQLRQDLQQLWNRVMQLEAEQNKAVDNGNRLIATRTNYVR